VLDGAGWHRTGGRLRVPNNITLLPVPAYAPELNPVANVWDYLRANLLSFQIWDTYEAIRGACCAAWNAFLGNRNRAPPSPNETGHRSAFKAVGITRPVRG
jgi:transposase